MATSRAKSTRASKKGTQDALGQVLGSLIAAGNAPASFDEKDDDLGELACVSPNAEAAKRAQRNLQRDRLIEMNGDDLETVMTLPAMTLPVMTLPAVTGDNALQSIAGSNGQDTSRSKQAQRAVLQALTALDPAAAETAAQADVPAESGSSQAQAASLEPVMRPNGEAYRPRLLGALSDVETLRACRTEGLPVLLAGYPGCGKTALVEAAFAGDVLTVNGHGDSEVADLIGSYTQRPDGSYVWIDGPLPRAMREGKVLFVDDTTLIPPGVLARLYPAMDGRGQITVTEHENETVNATEGFYVVGAHNPGAPGAMLSEALASRFLVHVGVESDLRLAVALGVPKRIVRAAAALQTRRAEGVVSWAPEMRELIAFGRVARVLGDELAAANMIAIAPVDDRDEVEDVLSHWYPGVRELRIGA